MVELYKFLGTEKLITAPLLHHIIFSGIFSKDTKYKSYYGLVSLLLLF